MFTTLYASLCIGNANFRQIFVKPFGVEFSNEWKGGASYYITFFVCSKEFMHDYWAKTYISYLLFLSLISIQRQNLEKNCIWLLQPNDFSRSDIPILDQFLKTIQCKIFKWMKGQCIMWRDNINLLCHHNCNIKRQQCKNKYCCTCCQVLYLLQWVSISKVSN